MYMGHDHDAMRDSTDLGDPFGATFLHAKKEPGVYDDVQFCNSNIDNFVGLGDGFHDRDSLPAFKDSSMFKVNSTHDIMDDETTSENPNKLVMSWQPSRTSDDVVMPVGMETLSNPASIPIDLSPSAVIATLGTEYQRLYPVYLKLYEKLAKIDPNMASAKFVNKLNEVVPKVVISETAMIMRMLLIALKPNTKFGNTTVDGEKLGTDGNSNSSSSQAITIWPLPDVATKPIPQLVTKEAVDEMLLCHKESVRLFAANSPAWIGTSSRLIYPSPMCCIRTPTRPFSAQAAPPTKLLLIKQWTLSGLEFKDTVPAYNAPKHTFYIELFNDREGVHTEPENTGLCLSGRLQLIPKASDKVGHVPFSAAGIAYRFDQSRLTSHYFSMDAMYAKEMDEVHSTNGGHTNGRNGSGTQGGGGGSGGHHSLFVDPSTDLESSSLGSPCSPPGSPDRFGGGGGEDSSSHGTGSKRGGNSGTDLDHSDSDSFHSSQAGSSNARGQPRHVRGQLVLEILNISDDGTLNPMIKLRPLMSYGRIDHNFIISQRGRYCVQLSVELPTQLDDSFANLHPTPSNEELQGNYSRMQTAWLEYVLELKRNVGAKAYFSYEHRVQGTSGIKKDRHYASMRVNPELVLLYNQEVAEVDPHEHSLFQQQLAKLHADRMRAKRTLAKSLMFIHPAVATNTTTNTNASGTASSTAPQTISSTVHPSSPVQQQQQQQQQQHQSTSIAPGATDPTVSHYFNPKATITTSATSTTFTTSTSTNTTNTNTALPNDSYGMNNVEEQQSATGAGNGGGKKRQRDGISSLSSHSDAFLNGSNAMGITSPGSAMAAAAAGGGELYTLLSLPGDGVGGGESHHTLHHADPLASNMGKRTRVGDHVGSHVGSHVGDMPLFAGGVGVGVGGDWEEMWDPLLNSDLGGSLLSPEGGPGQQQQHRVKTEFWGPSPFTDATSTQQQPMQQQQQQQHQQEKGQAIVRQHSGLPRLQMLSDLAAMSYSNTHLAQVNQRLVRLECVDSANTFMSLEHPRQAWSPTSQIRFHYGLGCPSALAVSQIDPSNPTLRMVFVPPPPKRVLRAARKQQAKHSLLENLQLNIVADVLCVDEGNISNLPALSSPFKPSTTSAAASATASSSSSSSSSSAAASPFQIEVLGYFEYPLCDSSLFAPQEGDDDHDDDNDEDDDEDDDKDDEEEKKTELIHQFTSKSSSSMAGLMVDVKSSFLVPYSSLRGALIDTANPLVLASLNEVSSPAPGDKGKPAKMFDFTRIPSNEAVGRSIFAGLTSLLSCYFMEQTQLYFAGELAADELNELMDMFSASSSSFSGFESRSVSSEEREQNTTRERGSSSSENGGPLHSSTASSSLRPQEEAGTRSVLPLLVEALLFRARQERERQRQYEKEQVVKKGGERKQEQEGAKVTTNAIADECGFTTLMYAALLGVRPLLSECLKKGENFMQINVLAPAFHISGLTNVCHVSALSLLSPSLITYTAPYLNTTENQGNSDGIDEDLFQFIFSPVPQSVGFASLRQNSSRSQNRLQQQQQQQQTGGVLKAFPLEQQQQQQRKTTLPESSAVVVTKSVTTDKKKTTNSSDIQITVTTNKEDDNNDRASLDSCDYSAQGFDYGPKNGKTTSGKYAPCEVRDSLGAMMGEEEEERVTLVGGGRTGGQKTGASSSSSSSAASAKVATEIVVRHTLEEPSENERSSGCCPGAAASDKMEKGGVDTTPQKGGGGSRGCCGLSSNLSKVLLYGGISGVVVIVLIFALLLALDSCALNINCPSNHLPIGSKLLPTESALFLQAFPGAKGYGTYNAGGRFGRVLYVTHLLSDPEGTQTGSLQWAVNQPGTRTVVFAVSGVFSGDLMIPHGNLTISGHSANQGGVTIEGSVVQQFPRDLLSNVILRHIRFRPPRLPPSAAYSSSSSSSAATPQQHPVDLPALATRPFVHAVHFFYSRNIVLDHLSVAWSAKALVNLGISSWVTLSWCTLEEPEVDHAVQSSFLLRPDHDAVTGPVVTSAVLSADVSFFSFHHNLVSFSARHNPLLGKGRADIRNNVFYYFTRGAELLDYSPLEVPEDASVPLSSSQADIYARMINSPDSSSSSSSSSTTISANTTPDEDTTQSRFGVNVVGNYYKDVSLTSALQGEDRQVSIPWVLPIVGEEKDAEKMLDSSKIYAYHIQDNFVEGIGLVVDPWTMYDSWSFGDKYSTFVKFGLDYATERGAFAPKEFETSNVATDAMSGEEKAQDVLGTVLAGAGSLPRDAVTARVISQTAKGSGWFGRKEPVGGLWHGLDRHAEAANKLNGYLSAPHADLTVEGDADQDGIPNGWEVKHGLNPLVADAWTLLSENLFAKNILPSSIPVNYPALEIYHQWLHLSLQTNLQEETAVAAKTQPTLYTLVVVNGCCSGSYAAGEEVALVARFPTSEQEEAGERGEGWAGGVATSQPTPTMFFSRWTTEHMTYLKQPDTTSTVFSMPPVDVRLEAVFVPASDLQDRAPELK